MNGSRSQSFCSKNRGLLNPNSCSESLNGRLNLSFCCCYLNYDFSSLKSR